MRATVVIAARNEGLLLQRTVESYYDATGDLDSEVIVVDDASEDGSVEAFAGSFPHVRICRHDRPLGASPAKATGARAARGDVLVFLDAHTKPEPGAVRRLVEDVEAAGGEAIVTPRVVSLDSARWESDHTAAGHGYSVDLLSFATQWRDLQDLRPVQVSGRPLFETPALIGCAFAMGRAHYDHAWGFDRHMWSWGVEDLDLGLKCWLLGYPLLHDPEATVAHRFRDSFDTYPVASEYVVANQIRCAYKHFTDAAMVQWLQAATARTQASTPEVPEGVWTRAWTIFERHRDSAYHERAYLQGRRRRDEFQYAERFALSWPRLAEHVGAPVRFAAPAAFVGSPRPSPSPSPRPAGIVLTSPAANTTLAIDGLAAMPQLVAEARITGVTPDPTTSTDFDWTITVTFDASACRHGPNRHINPPPVSQRTHGGRLAMAFPWVRGGALDVRVSAVVNARTVTTRSAGLRIVGTNPALADINAMLPHDVLRRIARHESACRQFDAAAGGGTSGCPLWSADNLGGVGVMQITNPAPTDDQVWSWRANVQAGVQTFSAKLPTARAYPQAVSQSAGFQQAVQALNAHRAAQHLPPVTVTVPNFTETGFAVPPAQLGQVELDAIRGFNGWGGRDAFGRPLHEFRLERDAQGLLVVDVGANPTEATARWQRVPATDRPQAFGDPDYVRHVLAAQPC